MEEIDFNINENGVVETQMSEEEHKDQLNLIVSDIVLEYKKRGSITMDTLFDKLEKCSATPNELEDIYKIFETEYTYSIFH